MEALSQVSLLMVNWSNWRYMDIWSSVGEIWTRDFHQMRITGWTAFSSSFLRCQQSHSQPGLDTSYWRGECIKLRRKGFPCLESGDWRVSWRGDCHEARPTVSEHQFVAAASSIQYQQHLLVETFLLKSWHLKRLWAKGFKLTTSKNLTTNSSPAARLSLTWSVPTSHHSAVPSDLTFVFLFVLCLFHISIWDMRWYL